MLAENEAHNPYLVSESTEGLMDYIFGSMSETHLQNLEKKLAAVATELTKTNTHILLLSAKLKSSTNSVLPPAENPAFRDEHKLQKLETERTRLETEKLKLQRWIRDYKQ